MRAESAKKVSRINERLLPSENHLNLGPRTATLRKTVMTKYNAH